VTIQGRAGSFRGQNIISNVQNESEQGLTYRYECPKLELTKTSESDRFQE
jgi:hypothetical protein